LLQMEYMKMENEMFETIAKKKESQSKNRWAMDKMRLDLKRLIKQGKICVEN